ncbi:MAG: ABC transporter ATP-binding protein [Bdellovibrionales bacterium]|nr:ABC transporter ATP-binding protein [Bdellovibrionales bacterium]
MIKVSQLTRKYGDFTAVDSVSFEIPKGAVVGLLGHNGAGKTTIMKMLTGYLEPTSGTATIDNLDVQSDRLNVQKKIGYLPENCPTYFDMSVVEYLEFVANLRSIPQEEQAEAIRYAVEHCQLHEKATSLISTLSRGYRQRVGVAQSIIHKPEILILDEPTNGLDPSQIHEMRQLIRDLSKNATVIISTHILQEVHAVCDRVLIMRHGKLALDSSLTDLESSDRLVLKTDQNTDKLQGILKNFNEITGLQLTREDSGVCEFLLDTKPVNGSLTPKIVKALVDQGCSLYSLHPQERSLESIFREINSSAQ